MIRRRRLVALAGGAALLAGCGSGVAATGQHRPAQVVRRVEPAATVAERGRVVVEFGAGRATRTVWLHEPSGQIRLYRLRAPAGTRVRTTVRLPGLTVPLEIATRENGAAGACVRGATQVFCTVSEEGCPMPAGRWRVRISKRAGPAGVVTLWFRVGGRRQPRLA